MDKTEHWRLRMEELIEARKLQQVQFATKIGVTADYVSRLLYPIGKKGRKRLGLKTMAAIRREFKLSSDWFDLPLGEQLEEPPTVQYPDGVQRILQPTQVSEALGAYFRAMVPNDNKELQAKAFLAATIAISDTVSGRTPPPTDAPPPTGNLEKSP